MMKAHSSPSSSGPEQFTAEVLKSEAEIDLGRAALLIAKCEYPSLDVEAYLRRLDQIAQVIATRVSAQQSSQPELLIEQINNYLYNELSLRGNVENYYDPKNSFL
ncbi:MAG: transglutaminase family protein, partial [Acidobacteriota bacterium]